MAQAPDTRFLVTSDLSRLAKWLRLLGFDAIVSDSNKTATLARICALQNRVLLTRIKRNEKLRLIKRLLRIEAELHPQQLRQVVQELDLNEFSLFSRCLYCNQKVYTISKEKILHKLPEKVKNREEHFTCCRKCGRIYWKGTHFDHMLQFLANALDGIVKKDIREFVLTEFR